MKEGGWGRRFCKEMKVEGVFGLGGIRVGYYNL